MLQGGRATRGLGWNDRKRLERSHSSRPPKGSYSVDKRLAPRIKQYIGQFRQGCVPDVEEIADFLQKKYGLVPQVPQVLARGLSLLPVDLSAGQLFKNFLSDREYSRKKRNTFRLSVQKVYQAICHRKDEETRLQNLEDRFLQKRRRSSPDFSSLMDNSEEGNQSAEEGNFTGQDSTDSELDLGDEPFMGSNLLNQSMHKMYSQTSGSRPVSEAEELSGITNNEAVQTIPDGSVTGVTRSGLETTNDSSAGNPAEVPSSLGGGQDGTLHKPMFSTNIVKATPPTSEKRKRDLKDDPVTPKQPGKKQKPSKNLGNSSRDKTGESKDTAFSPVNSTVKFSDIGGCDESIKDVCKLLVHLRHPEVFETIGITPPRGFLLHGPPGCGKTLLANAIAGELELPFIKIAATEIVSGVSGESEEKVRDLFARAVSHSPCVLFIDEIDAITPKRETASKDMERRIVSQLLTCMDELNENKEARVLVIGATNRPDSLEPALRRAGRFDREISMGIPDTRARERILRVLCKNLKLDKDFGFAVLAQQTPGYVGADLMALTREAAMAAVTRIFRNLEEEMKKRKACSADGVESVCEMEVVENEEKIDMNTGRRMAEDGQHSNVESVGSVEFNMMEWLKDQPPLRDEQLRQLFVEMEDFKEALASVQPSAKREGFATIPDVTWADVGALTDIREELTMAILAPVRHPEEFSALGLTHPPGILLAGPPGCGKTLLAKAIANESGINFISVKGPELLNMYVGESEKAVRQVFQRARNSSPCVIFFDELDALCPRRSGSSESSVGVRVVNQLLTEMDGLEARKQVFIMGATNRPDIIDPAVMRPGRLDKVLYVGLPTETDREDILRTITKGGEKPRLQSDVDIGRLAMDERCHGFSGADLAALVREAAVTALRDVIGTSMGQASAVGSTVGTGHKESVAVGLQHFEKAFNKVKPSVSEKDQMVYERIKEFAARL